MMRKRLNDLKHVKRTEVGPGKNLFLVDPVRPITWRMNEKGEDLEELVDLIQTGWEVLF